MNRTSLSRDKQLHRHTPVRGTRHDVRNSVAQRLARRMAQRLQNPTETWLRGFIRKNKLIVHEPISNAIDYKTIQGIGNISIRKIEADGTCLIHSILYLICPTYSKLSLSDQQRVGIAFRIQLAENPSLRDIRDALLENFNGRYSNLYFEVGARIADYLGVNLVKLSHIIELVPELFNPARHTLAVYFHSSHFDAVVSVIPRNILELYHMQFQLEEEDDEDEYGESDDEEDEYGDSKLQNIIRDVNGMYGDDYTDIITGIYLENPSLSQAQIVTKFSEIMFSGRKSARGKRKYARRSKRM
jgi:hypothetical protein